MRLLLIDNHDSFSAILHHYLWELAGERPLFFRNDELTRDELEALDFDAAVLSPGPGHPANVRDFGICRDLLDLFPRKPVLGVCLGMQGMAHFAGGTVAPWPGARHGRPSRIAHDGTGLFRGLPPEFTAVRYHSLIVEPESLPEGVIVTARSIGDDCVMGVSFADRPWFGIQFHPESVGTEHGMKLLGNFLDLVKPDRIKPVSASRAENPDRGGHGAGPAKKSVPIPHVELPWRDPAETFTRHFAAADHAVWLDAAASSATTGWPVTVMARAESVHEFHDWNAFQAWIASRDLQPDRDAPWPGYRGGPIGHLAYELHRDTLAIPVRGSSRGAGEALARWLSPEGWLVFDAVAGKVHAAWEGAAAPAWLRAVIEGWESPSAVAVRHDGSALPPFSEWTPRLSEAEYTGRVRSLQEAIARGDTYEACLTHSFSTQSGADPLAVFLRLRARNPAPYAAYLAFPDVRILSASPELFLEQSAGAVLRSRPIKGTRRRGGPLEGAAADRALRDDLAASEKDAAENRMIVDLTRHDLCRVCAPGSVEVSAFLEIEEHPAVFQLVSEVRGRMARGTVPVEAVAACFPGGSMTGAPKERTVELLAAVEAAPRGIYSGALGWITRGGAFTLAMVIRTLEQRDGGFWRTGCGGAVLIDSDPAAEWREATIKARSVIDAAAGQNTSTETA
jgi:para-aminobenzoate synthetase